ncbi:Activity-regulated cytoskeleton-associated protein [Folsomia candida]|uniref:Activity-regulated cytoskeleton-associated protein n=1 Tax=Folsomia candida TaxID=158441 RepID=A0A226DAA6_FOLCA|nr:Activity-regulated cytoskeleton-associated protein [Folsomia candida]
MDYAHVFHELIAVFFKPPTDSTTIGNPKGNFTSESGKTPPKPFSFGIYWTWETIAIALLSSLLDMRFFELDEMRIRLDELDDKVNPDTDPVLESILGPQFPINRPAAHSVKDYVDTHIGKMKTTLFHHQKNLAKQQDVDALRKEMSEFMNYVSSEYTKTFAQIYKETKQQNSPHMRIPPTLHNSVMREPHLPDDPNPFHDVSTISPITPHKNETNPFMTSDVILLLTAPADNPAYQPIITIPPQFNSTLPATAPNTVIYQSVGNIPIPKFRPYLETPENFLKEVELYMKRKRVMPEDWILMLPSVFKQDKHQSLWWQSTKLVVNSWDDFKSEFLQMYGSEMDKHQSVERLLNRRQKKNEPFNKFALEMNMIYRKIFKIDQSSHDTQIIQFVAERALPHIQTALLSCRAKNLVELINFGKIFEKSTPPEQTTKLASSHTNQATVRDGNRNPPPPPPPRQNYNNNNNPAPRPPQRQNNNNTPPRPPPRQNNNNRPRVGKRDNRVAARGFVATSSKPNPHRLIPQIPIKLSTDTWPVESHPLKVVMSNNTVTHTLTLLEDSQRDDIKDLLSKFPDVIDAPRIGRIKGVEHNNK